MGDLPGTLTRESFMLLAITAGPVIGALLVVGLVVGVFQAATQIQDPAVGFLPRFAAALLTVWIFGGWLIENMPPSSPLSLHRMSQH